jgi:hypothetical protein
MPPRKKIAADALSCLDIDERKISQDKDLTTYSLSESKHRNIKFPIYSGFLNSNIYHG